MYQDHGPEVYHTGFHSSQPGLEVKPVVDTPGLEVKQAAAAAFTDRGFESHEPYGDSQPFRDNGPTSSLRAFAWGLGPMRFAALVALITAIIVGGAVGGGLGALLSRQQLSSSSPAITGVSFYNASTNSSADLTDYAPVTAASVISTALDCPSLSRSSYRTFYKQSWSIYCGIDYWPGLPAVGGGTIRNLASIIAYSIQDCIEACSAINQQSDNFGVNIRCNAVTYRRALGEQVTDAGGNCWLKNATLTDIGLAVQNADAFTAKLIS